MALWQGKSVRTKTGRRIRYARGKRKFEIGHEQHLTTIGPPRLKKVRTNSDQDLKLQEFANEINTLERIVNAKIKEFDG